MRKNLLTIVLILFLMTLQAQTTRNVSLSFNAGDFETKEMEGKLQISSSIHPIVFSIDTLAPALPLVCINILLGPNETYKSYSYTETETLLTNNVILPPNQIPIPTNQTSYRKSSQDIVFRNNTYPEKKIDYTGTQDIGGYRLVSFLVCPFRYEPMGGKLYFTSNVTLKIDVDNSLLTNKASHLALSTNTRNCVRALVSNSNDIDILYPANHRSTTTSILLEPLQYLIITNNAFKDEFQRLADWKTAKGCKTEVATVENIYTAYQDSINPMKIKHAIKDAYNASDGALYYVLLAGVPSIVPAQACYAQTTSQGVLYQKDIPADIYYACLTDLVWDKNGNGHFGEVEDTVSVSPDIVVTRLPVTDITDAQRMVSRIIKYEKTPDISHWKNEALMCGVKLWDNISYGGAIVSDAHAKSEEMYQNCFSGWNGSKYRFYDTGTDHIDSANYNITQEHLQAELNKGYSFVNVITHGMPSYWSMESPSANYQSSDAWYLNNLAYSIITTDACYANDYSNPSTALGSYFMRSPQGNILGYYGTSMLNWGLPGSSIDLGLEYLCWMYKKIFDVHMGLGDAIYFSKKVFASSYNVNGFYRWLHYAYNAFCDPEMPVYTAQPETFGKGFMNTYHDDFYFTHPQGTALNVCVMSRLDKGATYYERRGMNDALYFSNVPTECLVTVTSHNRIPYQAIHGGIIRLQNENLTDSIDVVGTDIYIGSNVATNRPQGPVAVENGYSVIASGGSTTIYNDFEVPIGASILITNHN